MSNYDKLTPEQKVIADKWAEEKAGRQRIIDDLKDGKLTLEQAMPLLEGLSPEYCEHGRHIVKSCLECEEIDRILHPELFAEEDS